MAVKSKFYIATSKGWEEVNFGGTGSGSFYGVSKENTINRTVTLTNDDSNFELTEGATVNVKFTYASSSGSMTLNVNKTGAKTIKRNGSDTTEWKAGAIVNLIYDGSNWIMSSGTDNHYEAFLDWGGKAIAGSISPLDAAASNLHSANRFAFAKPAGITIEYSRDGGSNWTVYDTTDASKVNLVSGNTTWYNIGGQSTDTTINDKLRITLNATNMGVYTRLHKLLININTNYATGSNVKVEKAMKGNEASFSLIATYDISGWSGWNSIPFGGWFAFGGGSNQTSNVAAIRLTFGITGINSSQTLNVLQVGDIVAIGETYWAYPSTMAKTGHLYGYDSSQNAAFPGIVSAPLFRGKLVLDDNVYSIQFRTSAGAYRSGFYYANGGNEALTLATSGINSAIQFINGQDPGALTNVSWQSLKPALQIKGNKVAINKVIATGTSPDYELDVNGTTGISGDLILHKNDANYSSNSKSRLIFSNGSTEYAALSATSTAFVVNPSSTSTENQFVYYFASGQLEIPGNIKENGTILSSKYALKDHGHSNYLPLSGGTLTGALTLPSQTSVWGDIANIAFSSGGKITGNVVGDIGIQGTTGIYFRPTNASTYQMTLDSSGLHPGTSKNISLGTSSYYWNNIYGTTIYENGTSLANKYALKSDITNIFKFKGSVTFSDYSDLASKLNSLDAEPGDVYNLTASVVISSSSTLFPNDKGYTLPAGTNIVYLADDNGYYWESLGGTVDLSAYITQTTLTDTLKSYSLSSHDHDGRYYTETEVNTKLDGKANVSHKHVDSDITAPANDPASDNPWALCASGGATKWTDLSQFFQAKGNYATQTWVTNQGYSKLALGTTSTTAAKGDHTHNYAGSSSAGGSASYVAWSVASDNVARRIPFAYNSTTETTNDRVRMCYDDDFKYNPSSNTLFVNSISTNANQTMTISSASTIYTNRQTAASFIWQIGGTAHARFDTAGHFRPEYTKTYDIGASEYYWNNIYGTTIYENGTSLANKYLSKSGGAMTGTLSLVSSVYGTNGCGLDAKNSDIVNVNGLRLADTTNTWHEGILFPSFGTSGNWDMLYTQEDGLYFALNQAAGDRSGIRVATMNDVNSKSSLKPQHNISAGDDQTHYYKLITIKPTSTAYADLYYEFDVVARANKYAKIRIYVITVNDNRYISSVYVNSDGALGIDNFKVYKFRDTTNKIDRVEVWCKVTSWDTLEFYPKTSDLPSEISFTWDKTEGTAFPTDATSTIAIEKKSWIGNAATATKATQDGNGNNIVNTYALKTHTQPGTTITGPSGDAQTVGPFLLANEGSGAASNWIEKGNLLNGYATQTWVNNQKYSKLTLGSTADTAAKGDHTHSNILTIAPTSANTTGEMRFVVLSSEPSQKYAGYLYIITG